jgi:hypothetical protein
MRIADEHIAAIQSLGYTSDEARFLYIVATHSGYFVPRQFVAFVGAKWGKRSNNLTKKLESRGHATWREYQSVGGVYHLFSKTLYRLIDKENLRNRRRHSREFIQTRLILLDFVLANQAFDYLETEQDKLRYFCQKLHVPETALPTKVYAGAPPAKPTLRYFVDKFPLFIDSSNTSSPTVVTLSYVDPGHASLAGFAHHLQSYAALFRQLAGFRFLYIANSSAHFSRAEECFLAARNTTAQSRIGREILRYFELRRNWDSKQYAILSNQDLEWLRRAKDRFAGKRMEELYEGWRRGAVANDALLQQSAPAVPGRNVAFATYLVNGQRNTEEQADEEG